MKLARSGALCLLIGCSAYAEPTDSVAIERPAPRVRAGLGGGAMGAVVMPGGALGLGLAGDLGIVVSDRVALSVRIAAAMGFLTYGAATVNGEYALSDALTLGIGAGLTATGGLFLVGSPSAAGVVFPLRGTLWLGDHEPQDSRRRGFVVSLALSPGFTFAGNTGGAPAAGQPKFPGFAFATELTLGYALF